MITKDDDKKLKDQSKNYSSESRTIQEFKIRIKKNSRLKRKFDFKNQDSRFKLPRIKIKIQDSRFKNQEKN